MSRPDFSSDLVAIIDREHARVRDIMDGCPQLLEALEVKETAALARLVALDALTLARDPEQMMYRLAAWEQLCREHGG